MSVVDMNRFVQYKARRVCAPDFSNFRSLEPRTMYILLPKKRDRTRCVRLVKHLSWQLDTYGESDRRARQRFLSERPSMASHVVRRQPTTLDRF